MLALTRRRAALGILLALLTGCSPADPLSSFEGSLDLPGAAPANRGAPLVIEPLPGPRSPAAFAVRDRRAAAFFTDTGFALSLPGVEAGWGVLWSLEGARATRPSPGDVQPGRVNHLVGAPSRWVTDLPTYGELAWREPYPGVDMLVEPREHGIEYRFVAAPGVDPSVLRVHVSGALDIAVAPGGRALNIETGAGSLPESGLRCYQEGEGGPREVACRYAAVTRGGELEWDYGFEIGAYDRGLPLIIDPVIDWSSFLGGEARLGPDVINAVAVDAAGDIYLAGTTGSPDFPTTGGFDATLGGTHDAFVAKVSGSGSTLFWSTLVGGSGVEQGYGVAVDPSGNVFVTGSTVSADFPAPGGVTLAAQGGSDAFVLKLAPAGDAILWSKLLGGAAAESGNAITTDAAGDAYVTGETTSTNFPQIAGIPAVIAGGTSHSFATKLTGAGAIQWSSVLLPINAATADYGRSIAVDVSGAAVIAGETKSGNNNVAYAMKIDPSGTSAAWKRTLKGAFVQTNAYGVALGPSADVFVVGRAGTGSVFVDYNAAVWRLDANGNQLWSKTLGVALSSEAARAAAGVDATGNLVFVGDALSGAFPVSGGFDLTMNGASDAFIAKLNPAGNVVWSSFLGGVAADSARAAALQPSGNAVVAGLTTSPGLATPGVFGQKRASSFVSSVSGSGSALLWTSYVVGGTGPTLNEASTVTTDPAGNGYVVGWTSSLDFPSQGGLGGGYLDGADAFVTKIDGSTRTIAWSSYLGGTDDDYALGVAVDGAGSAVVVGWTESPDFPLKSAFDSTLGGSDGFVARLSPSGSSLDWSSYLGGGDEDRLSAVAYGASGEIYVGGWTESNDFPVTVGPPHASANGIDAFVARLNPAGSVAWSTIYGGGGSDPLLGMAVDAVGVYVTGQTGSSNLPVPGGFSTMLSSPQDAYVARFNPASGALVYGSYFGGSANDTGTRIAARNGSIYISGYSSSTSLPALGPTTINSGASDAYVARIDGSPPTLAWATFLGGSKTEFCNGLAVDAAGKAYVVGRTDSSNFPTLDAVDSTFGGTQDGFAAALDPSGATLWSTFIGGSNIDVANDVTVDAANGVWVVGTTQSLDFAVGGGFDSSWTSDPIWSYRTMGFVLRLSTGVNGSSCASAQQCASGFCADGVCCDAACSAGPCDACSIAAGAPADGACVLLTGPACNDGDACTTSDTCQGGVCVGANPIACVAVDECHDAGVCDPATGKCSQPPKLDGAACAGGVCSGGVCLLPGSSSSSGSGVGGAGGDGTSSGVGGAGGAGGVSTGSSTSSGIGGDASTGGAGNAGSSTGGESASGTGTAAGATSTSSGGAPPDDAAGCNCHMAGAPTSGGAWAAMSLLLASRLRRRRPGRRAEP